MQESPWLVAAHVHEHVGDVSRHLVRRCTDVGDPGRKAGLIGCPASSTSQFAVTAMSGVTRSCEAVQMNARSRASASATGRRARPAAAHATASAARKIAMQEARHLSPRPHIHRHIEWRKC